MESEIFAPQVNMGNGVVGRVVKDPDVVEEDFNAPVPISVVPLDSVAPVKVSAPLVKIDVQGYECEAIRGSLTALQRAQVVVMEIAPHWLDGTYLNGYCTKVSSSMHLLGLCYFLFKRNAWGIWCEVLYN